MLRGIFVNKKLMKRLLAQIMLLADYDNVGWGDRLKYAWNAVINFAPVAIVLDLFCWWFSENEQFGQFMIVALFINMVVGVVFHFRNKTFSCGELIIIL